MSVIIFFSANKNNLFCRNDVQAIDFLRKGSYARGLRVLTLRISPHTQVELSAFGKYKYIIPLISNRNIISFCLPSSVGFFNFKLYYI